MKHKTKKQLEQAIKRISATDDGRAFLAFLCKECGFQQNLVNYDNVNQTMAFAAMRGLYAKLRRYIPRKDLVEIENYYEFKEKVEKK